MRAARWVLSDYSRDTSVTLLLLSLNWLTLQQCRLSSRLTLFYKIVNNQLPMTLSPYYLRMQYHTRQYHQDHYIVPQSNTNGHKYSFYPRTIRDWNILPVSLIESAILCSRVHFVPLFPLITFVVNMMYLQIIYQRETLQILER